VVIIGIISRGHCGRPWSNAECETVSILIIVVKGGHHHCRRGQSGGQADGFQSWVEIVGSRLGSRSIVFDVSFLSGVMLLQASLLLPSSAVVLIVVGQSQNVEPVSERQQGQKPGKSK